MLSITRGARRRSDPDIFLSHSSQDKDRARRLATDLNFCGVDAWLDEWEIQIGQSLPETLANAMEKSRFVAVLISENYNNSIWTKAEYKKALAREQREGRVVLLPLILGGSRVPDFIEDKVYLDLRDQYYSGLVRISGMVHNLSEFRITRAIRERPPQRVRDIWRLFSSLGFAPFVVFGEDDFEEILKHGGSRIREGFAHFFPEALLRSDVVSDHVKSLLREIY